MSLSKHNKRLINVAGILFFSFSVITVILKFFVPVTALELTNIAAFQFIIYIFILYWLFSKNIEHVENLNFYYRGMGAIGKGIKKDQLYQNMLTAVTVTNSTIRVTYFNNTGPYESGNEMEEQYQNVLEDKIKNKNNVSIRRVIYIMEGDSDQKREWIKKQLKIAENNKKKDGQGGSYQIRFINEEGGKKLSEKAPIINIQIFDNNCFVIDPSRKNDELKPRDIHMVSEDITGIWERYYDQILWESAKSAKRVGYDY